MKGLFQEWFNLIGENIYENNHRVLAMRLAYEAGYNQRSSEVAEDLRLFKGLMDGIRLDPDEVPYSRD